MNQVLLSEIDNIYIDRSKPINIIAVLPNIMECVEDCKLVDANELIINDHQAYLIDINFERYFEAQLSAWDQIN